MKNSGSTAFWIPFFTNSSLSVLGGTLYFCDDFFSNSSITVNGGGLDFRGFSILPELYIFGSDSNSILYFSGGGQLNVSRIFSWTGTNNQISYTTSNFN